MAGVARKPPPDFLDSRNVSVTGIWGDHTAKLDELVADIDQIKERDFDLAVVAVKSYDLEDAASQLARIMPPRTKVFLMQNGYGNFEVAARYLPGENLVVGRLLFGTESLQPGVSRVNVFGDDVIFGSPGNQVDMRLLDSIAGSFTLAGIPTRPSGEIMKYIWGKIIYNSALNSLGAIFEVNYGKLAEAGYSRLLMNDLIKEIFDILQAMKQDTLWPGTESYLQDFYGKMVPLTAFHIPSMLQDIRRGRRTEIDVLNGAIVELGKKHGVDTPVNYITTLMVKAKEQLTAVRSI